MKVVIDTNVFISGIFWKGCPYEVLRNWKEAKFTLVCSPEIISEIYRVLSNFEIRLPEEIIKQWIMLIINKSIMVNPGEKINVIKEDYTDNKFIEAAIAGDARYVVSGDKHLLRLKEFGTIKIITCAEFTKML